MQDNAKKWVHWSLITDPESALLLGFRVYPIIAPQGATRGKDGRVLTFAVLKEISEYRDTVSLVPADEAPAWSVVVDCYAETHIEVQEVAAAVRRAIHQATETAWGSKVLYSLHKAGLDDLVVPADGKAVPLYAYSQTFEVRLGETL
jgi:hypothetical protein